MAKKKKVFPDFPEAPLPPPEPPPPEPPWWLNPPSSVEGMVLLLGRKATRLQEDSEEGHQLRALYQKVQEQYQLLAEQIKVEFPIAYFKPSFEQSLLLNAWWCGYDFPVCFAANRIGKTAAFVINALLWIFPNNPAWECFAPSLSPSLSDDPDKPWHRNPHQQRNLYIDIHGREVQILPRPPIKSLDILKDILKRHPHLQGNPLHSHLDIPSGNKAKFASLQQLFPVQTFAAWPSPPVTEDGTIWLGAPDFEYHKTIVLKEWKRWTPKSAITKWSLTDLAFDITTQSSTNPRTTNWEILTKSYDSEDTKWSGAAVHAIILTEGLSETIFNEVRQRIKANGFGSWDYTPYESRNAGQKTALAFKVFRGEEQLPLSAFIFTKFSARNAPSHVLPTAKRQDLIRMWDGKKEGAARLDGDFYSTSPLVLSKLDRTFHTVPWTKEELFKRFPSGQIYRGFDPGYDHPTACAWGLLTPSNKWFIFRIYSARQRTISERCEDVIILSGNKRIKIKQQNKHAPPLFKEVHPFPHSEPVLLTAADYHLFKTDEQSGNPYVLNYQREGLILTESTHMRPRDRAVELDRKLTRSNFLTHPTTGKCPGAEVFFLLNETGVDDALHKLESLFWERLQGGAHKGEAKDEVPLHGDDELDAICYITCGGYIHTNYQPTRHNNFRELEDEQLASLQL